MTQHEYDIMLLLRDYNNYLPGGSGECYVPMTDGTHMSSSPPTTAASAKRFDTTSLTGETYASLDKALRRLAIEHPLQYNAIQILYLEDDTGHRDVDHLRKSTSPDVRKILLQHDEAIRTLGTYLDNSELYVRRPSASVKPSSKDLGDMNEALFLTYLRFREQGINHRQSIQDALIKFPEYTKKGAEKIVGERLSSEAQRLYS